MIWRRPSNLMLFVLLPITMTLLGAAAAAIFSGDAPPPDQLPAADLPALRREAPVSAASTQPAENPDRKTAPPNDEADK